MVQKAILLFLCICFEKRNAIVNKEELMEKIRKKKETLYETVSGKELTSEEVLQVSRELDQLLHLYHLCGQTPKKRRGASSVYK